VIDSSDDPRPPEVTIEPADNGHVVRWHQRSSKKDQPGRSVRRVASTVDEALAHAKSALGGGAGGSGGSTKSSKKHSSTRSLGRVADDEAGAEVSSPAAHQPASHSLHHSSARRATRRRARTGGRR